MVQYIKHELKKIFLRWETWVVLAICFAVALAGIMLFYRRQYSLAAGFVSISCIAIVKHLKRFSHEEESVADTADAQNNER